jgi:hypothetical protein
MTLPPRVLALLGAVAVAAGTAVAATSAAASAPLEIRSLSNRADLVSGGDVLLEILPARTPARVVVRDRDVTRAFALRPNGRRMGVLRDLPVGRSEVVARSNGRVARLTVTNHPVGGPVFSGPQVQPWVCETAAGGLGPAKDKQCSAPTKVEYFYKPPLVPRLQAYDPASPPGAVDSTTTDQGKTVPFIVRRETGTLNRGIFTTAVLWDPAHPATPWAAGPWNHKLYYRFEGGAAPNYRQGSSNWDVLNVDYLGRGFALATSTMNKFEQNMNTVTSAETAVMLKERIVEQLGEIRYTIATGGSGGSIQVQTIANSYPGLLDGIIPVQSFQDAWTLSEVADCTLLNRYYALTSPHLWTVAAQQGAVNGHQSNSSCNAWDRAFNMDQTVFDPTIGCVASANPVPRTPEAPWVYDPSTNPRGTRCTLQDFQSAILGPRPRSAWGAVEKRIGRGFANRGYDNVGVQYGLKALQQGLILPEQFVDLNEQVGGLDIDLQWQPQRSTADPLALSRLYRSGQVNDATNLDLVPMIDVRGHINAEIHTAFHTQIMKARLDAANGHHRNQVQWIYEAPHRENEITLLAFDQMDAWLTRIEHDHTSRPREQKVVANRPSTLIDTCFLQSLRVTDPAVCSRLFPYYADPRIAAGSPLTDDVLKCQLKPVRRSEYPAELTDDQWNRLKAVFPTGVCDYTKGSAGRTKTVTWLRFPTPGGVPLGAAPRSR